MQLIIWDKEDKYSYDFLDEVLNKMKILGMSSYNPDKVYKQELYLNDIPKYKSIYKKYIPVKEAVMSGMWNLMWSKNNGKIVFEIDFNEYIPQTSAKLNEVCRMINDGTLSFQPYPIFTDLFKKVRKDIDLWYDYYQEKGVL